MTIKLKSGLTWSDGQTLNADDLLYSLNLGRDDAKLDATGQWGSKKFSSVEKVNDDRRGSECETGKKPGIEERTEQAHQCEVPLLVSGRRRFLRAKSVARVVPSES